MVKVMKYTGNRPSDGKPYQFPNGEEANVERVLKEYPMALTFTHVIETDDSNQVIMAFNNLAALRSIMGIDPALTEDAAIAEIERLRNLPPEEPQPSAEERIAAAMEFQNLMSF